MPLSRGLRSKSTWGGMSPSGSTYLNRMEWGMRGAFLVGPSFNGIEGTLVAGHGSQSLEILEVTG